MLRTYKYLLRPRPVQDQALDFLLWQARLLYNAALEQRITTYRETGRVISYPEQWTHFRDVRHANPDTIGKLNAASAQQMLRRLDKAFAAFFRRIKAGETPGFPRFRSQSRFHSLEYRYGDGCKLRKDDQGRMSLYLQNIGEIKLVYHRAIPKQASLKHLVLKRTNQCWYACLMLELPDPEPVAHTGPAVGVDMGLHHLLALSDGTLIENPRWLRENMVHLRVLQRKAARRQKGSRRQQKAYGQVARLQEKVANQRRDFWHQLTNRLAKTYSLIGIEDLHLAFMLRNQHLSLSAHDAALAEFRHLLSYKVANTGSQLMAVNPAYTSQSCSVCGEMVFKDLNVRIHACPNCCLVLDRDINAARNILKLAFQLPGRGGQALTWAVTPSVA